MTEGAIVLCACCEFGREIALHLIQEGMQPAAIVGLSPILAARNNVAGYFSFDGFAAEHGIPLYEAQSYSLTTPEDKEFFERNRFDLLIMGGWQRLIPDDIIGRLRVGGVGAHGSDEFLPMGRGRSPLNWSLIEGRDRFIMQLFLIKPGVDDGDIIDYQMFDINPWDTCRSLYYKYAIVAKRMLAQSIPRLLDGTARLVPQKGPPSYYPKRTPEDGRIDWNRSYREIYDFIRALTHPYPGAFSYRNGEQKSYFWRAVPFDTRIVYRGTDFGRVVEVFSTGDFVVNCRSGLLLVQEADVRPHVGDTFGDFAEAARLLS